MLKKTGVTLNVGDSLFGSIANKLSGTGSKTVIFCREPVIRGIG